jgi:hypothetical protein
MIIKCTVSRIVAADDKAPTPPRVFLLPEKGDDLRWVDGSKRTASGEIPVDVKTLDGAELGSSVGYRVEDGTIVEPVAPSSENA